MTRVKRKTSRRPTRPGERWITVFLNADLAVIRASLEPHLVDVRRIGINALGSLDVATATKLRDRLGRPGICLVGEIRVDKGLSDDALQDDYADALRALGQEDSDHTQADAAGRRRPAVRLRIVPASELTTNKDLTENQIREAAAREGVVEVERPKSNREPVTVTEALETLRLARASEHLSPSDVAFLNALVAPGSKPPSGPGVDVREAIAALRERVRAGQLRPQDLPEEDRVFLATFGETRLPPVPSSSTVHHEGLELTALGLGTREIQQLVKEGRHAEVRSRFARARQDVGLSALQPAFETYQRGIEGVREATDLRWDLEHKQRVKRLLNALATALDAVFEVDGALGLLHVAGGGTGSFQLRSRALGNDRISGLGQGLPLFKIVAPALPTRK